MKNTIFIISTLLSFNCVSQMQSVILDWHYSLSDSITHSAMQEIYVDGDAVSDIRISDSYHDSTNIVEVLLHDGHLNADNHMIIDNCPASGWSSEEIDGYIYTSLTYAEVQAGFSDYNYSNQSVKMPFNFNGNDGNHCGFLFVKYLNFDITVQGLTWNTVAGATCSCNASGNLGVSEIKLNNEKGNFTYFNMLGQRLENPTGIVLKVYESGAVEKVFIVY